MVIVHDPRNSAIGLSDGLHKATLVKHLAHCAHLHLRAIAADFLELLEIRLVSEQDVLELRGHCIPIDGYYLLTCELLLVAF